MYLSTQHNHEFTHWGYWMPIYRPVDLIINNEPPKYEPLEAFRRRRCVHCDIYEIEDYSTGAISVFDPHREPLGV